MALKFDTSCLFSTVKNGTGGRRKFGFLPPHGRELDTDEEFTVWGDIREAIIGLDRVTRPADCGGCAASERPGLNACGAAWGRRYAGGPDLVRPYLTRC